MAIYIENSIFIVVKTGMLYTWHCKICFRTLSPLFNLFGFCCGHSMHTRFSSLKATYQYQRGVSFVISLQHAVQKNADGNCHCAATSYSLHLFMHQTQTNFDEKGTRIHNTGTTIRITKSGSLRMCRRRGDAAAVYYGCLYLSITVR